MACLVPFTELRCHINGYATCCLSRVSNTAMVFDTSLAPWEIWNHENFQQLRAAARINAFNNFCIRNVTGNYKRQACPLVAPAFQTPKVPWLEQKLSQPPMHLVLEFDSHCNLHCPACRPTDFVAANISTERLHQINAVCNEFLPTAETLTVAGGDPLVGRHTLEILSRCSQYPRLQVILFTNGLLLPDRWDQLPQKQISCINLSIDAATAQTYERVRSPGKWEDLQRTLDFIGQQKIPFNAHFVVQQANYREMPAFVEMCLQRNASAIYFVPFVRYYQTDDLYRVMNVRDPLHSEHQEFQQTMTDQRLYHERVKMFGIR